MKKQDYCFDCIYFNNDLIYCMLHELDMENMYHVLDCFDKEKRDEGKHEITGEI